MDIEHIEQKLWQAADKLRNNMEKDMPTIDTLYAVLVVFFTMFAIVVYQLVDCYV